DREIIKREFDKDPSAEPKLTGKEYTLAHIKTYGGVCAHQADFACRTAQSLGIPAVHCAGASAYRDRDAWWMFVNVSSATKDESSSCSSPMAVSTARTITAPARSSIRSPAS